MIHSGELISIPTIRIVFPLYVYPPIVMTLAYGGSDIYEGWMKNKNSAMISCNDGFRPVSFYIEVLDEKIY